MALEVPIAEIGKEVFSNLTIERYKQKIESDPELKALLVEYRKTTGSIKIKPFRVFIKAKRDIKEISVAKAKEYKREAALLLKAFGRFQS